MSPRSEHRYTTNPRQFYSLGFSGRSVEKLTVNQALTVQSIFALWQNLADPCRAGAAEGRVAGQRAAVEPRSGALDLRAQKLFGAGGLVVANAPQCRHEEKGQAADRRIAGHDDPGGKREGRRRRHRRHSDHCRNQKHPRNHLTHPPRYAQSQPGGGAWQDYGRPWENLRPVVQPGPEYALRLATATFAGIGRNLILRVDVRRVTEPRDRRKLLKSDGNSALPVVLGCRPSHPDPQAEASAATCRKAKRSGRAGNPDVGKECLSFVMPRQQGTPALEGFCN